LLYPVVVVVVWVVVVGWCGWYAGGERRGGGTGSTDGMEVYVPSTDPVMYSNPHFVYHCIVDFMCR